MCAVCDSLMNCGVLVPPMNAQSDGVGVFISTWDETLRCAFIALHDKFVFLIQQESVSE